MLVVLLFGDRSSQHIQQRHAVEIRFQALERRFRSCPRFRLADMNSATIDDQQFLSLEATECLIEKGRKAVQKGSVTELISTDMAFHHFVYGLSENLLVAPTMDTHWTYTQRVMGEVLMMDEKPRDIWHQHEELLQAIVDGDGDAAERMARDHITQAASFILSRLSVPA